MAVDTIILQLIDVIQKEVEMFERLLKTMKEEQAALVGHDVEALERTVEVQRDLTEKAAALERARAEVVRSLCESMGEDPSVLTMKQIIEKVGAPHDERLGALRQDLLDLHEEIQRSNQQNALLVKQSMKYVDKSLQILTGEGPATGVYAKTGKVASETTSRAVLNEVV